MQSVVILGLLLFSYCLYIGLDGSSVETDNAYVKANFLKVSPEINGRVLDLYVHENQYVEAGSKLFELDKHDLMLDLERKRAELAGGVIRLSSLKAQYEQILHDIDVAGERVEFARREFERQHASASMDYVSAAELDALKHKLTMEIEGAERLNLLLEEVELELGGYDAEFTSHPTYRSLVSDIQKIKEDINRASVVAPSSGVVSKLPRVGQFLREGETSLIIVESDDVWIEANFSERDTGAMRAGQEAAITIDAYPGHIWSGVVESIPPATGSEYAIIPPQNASGNWVKIAQRLPVRIRPEISPGQPRLIAGLSAVVEVALN